jgi:hypothetical protein
VADNFHGFADGCEVFDYKGSGVIRVTIEDIDSDFSYEID